MKKHKSVDDYFLQLEKWQAEAMRLREILLSMDISESLKWSMPVYTANGKNIVGIGAAQSYFGLWFYQGALLADQEGVLVNAQEGKTKAMRQWRFSSKKEIKVRLIKKYVQEAVAHAEQGNVIKPNRNKPVIMPRELTLALNEDPQLKSRFETLTKSCRREYADYISEAKKEATKQRRLEKIIPMIMQSVGLNDKYRNC